MVREDRVGIVIPAFNAAGLVVEAAESALEALGSTDNIVIVDDGSSDSKSLAELDRLRARGFRVIRQANAGVSVARNAGIAALEVPYALTLDSDDLVGSSAPSVAADALDSDEDIAIATGAMIKFDELGNRSDVLPPTHTTRDGMRHETRIHVGSVFRVADWATTQGFPAGLRFGEDWVFWMRLLRLRPNIHVSSSVFNFRREHSGQVTGQYIDPRESAKAKLLVMQENPDLVAAHVDEFITEYADTLSTLAAYRYAYRRLDALKTRVRRFVPGRRASQ